MSNKHYRRITQILLYLVCALASTHTLAQAAPAAATSTPTPYSPLVSFGTLPALQVATPIPGSQHVPNDFNGDGTSDLLWFNPTQSQVGYWTMTAVISNNPTNSGVTRTSARAYNVTPGYFVGATGDFNNDGYADLVFTSANRDLWLWTNDLHGGWISTKIGTYPSQWQLIGAGDIDGDGYDDLLWLDPSECKFGYWTMKGAVQTGYKIMDVACGYYPIGIGYYTPSNRLSILWTSPANDLYIWDSTGNGFTSYNLTPYVGSMANTWAIGGGFMGSGMGIEVASFTNGAGLASANLYSRTFDAAGNQTGFVGEPLWNGGAITVFGSAGYLIKGNGINATALYGLNQGTNIITTDGLPTSNLITSGNGASLNNFTQWTYPVGWYVVGAPANKTAAPPWQ